MVYLSDGVLVGGRITLHQAGGAFDESAPQSHYETAEEAQAAGGDTERDVNWQARANFILKKNGKFELFPYSHANSDFAFEWSGW